MTDYPVMGSTAHARLVTHGRHPAVFNAMAWLAFNHLPGPLQDLSRPLYRAAMDLLIRIPNDTTDLTAAMNKLVEAKDCFVRAGIHSDQGAPGPIPRPATVVDPPTNWPQTAQDLILGDADRIAQHLPQWRENWPTTPAPKVPGQTGFAPQGNFPGVTSMPATPAVPTFDETAEHLKRPYDPEA